MAKIRTHYDNLKVSRDAPPEVIRAAYRSLVAKHHPDRNRGNAKATKIMVLLNEAYEVLSDPEKRANHDDWIRKQESAEATPTSPPPSEVADRCRDEPVFCAQFKKFRIQGETLTWKGREFGLNEIVSIYFHRAVTTQKMNFVEVGKAHSAELVIKMADGAKIPLEVDESTIIMGWNRDKSTDLQLLNELYVYLCKTTFHRRISQYLEQIKEKGFFRYGECLFYPPDKIVWRDQVFMRSECHFMKSYGFISIQRINSSLLDRLKRQVVRGPGIETLHDADVVFALLGHFFRIEWE